MALFKPHEKKTRKRPRKYMRERLNATYARAVQESVAALRIMHDGTPTLVIEAAFLAALVEEMVGRRPDAEMHISQVIRYLMDMQDRRGVHGGEDDP